MIILKPQDVVVLLKLGLTREGAATTLAKLGAELGISASEVHAAINRAAAAGLLDLEHRRPRVLPFLEFLEHGIRYVFVSRPGGITRGIPTAHSAPPLNEFLMQGPVRRMFSNPALAAADPEPYAPAPPGPIQTMYADRLADAGVTNPYELPTPIVWPHPEGTVRGESLEPLYPSAVDAARRDDALYESLALVDALRIGRARERKLAVELIGKRLRPS
jgi:hypothetical protein